MLTQDQREKFDRMGFVHLKGAFSHEDARAMHDLLWRTLGELYGARSDRHETWDIPHVAGLQSIKSDPVFDPIGSATVIAAIDDLLGKGGWQMPAQWGQFLVTFPKPHEWNVPVGWHTDFDFTADAGVLSGVLAFSFLNDVQPRGGGTAVLTGSHRLMQRFIDRQPAKLRAKMKTVRKAFLDSNPWLTDLDTDEDRPGRVARFMDGEHEIDGIPVRVVELTGDAGDVIIGHPWLLHAAAPNCGDGPRFMRVQRIHKNA